MSFILTKNGKIYETDATNDSEEFIGIKSVVENCFSTLIGIGRKNVIRQGEDLKSLCDAFVHDEDIYFPEVVDGCLQTFDYERESFEITDKMIEEGIYGAVWTNWGLRYITKMNSKRELEIYESKEFI